MYKSRRRRIKLVLHMRNSFYLVDYIYYIDAAVGGCFWWWWWWWPWSLCYVCIGVW